MIFPYVFQAHSSEIHIFLFLNVDIYVWRDLYMSRHAVKQELTATCLYKRRLILSAQRDHMNRFCSHNQPWHYSSVAHIMEVSPDHTLNIHVVLL